MPLVYCGSDYRGGSRLWGPGLQHVNNNPVNSNDPSGHCPWCIVGAIIGAAVGYGVQVYNNYQSGYTGSDAWTSNISGEAIVGGALAGAGAVIFAPAAVALVADGVTAVGLATGSTTIFSAGMATYGASTALENIIAGSQVPANSSVTSTPSPNSKTNYGPEVKSPDPVRPGDVTDRWDEFLGEKPYTDIGPNKLKSPDRIFSDNGQASVRYGQHEMDYSHYHTETWTYNSTIDTFNITNTWVRIQPK